MFRRKSKAVEVPLDKVAEVDQPHAVPVAGLLEELWEAALPEASVT
jgi:hypothetical protein